MQVIKTTGKIYIISNYKFSDRSNWKFNFPSFQEIMTLTDHPTNQLVDRREGSWGNYISII